MAGPDEKLEEVGGSLRNVLQMRGPFLGQCYKMNTYTTGGNEYISTVPLGRWMSLGELPNHTKIRFSPL